MNASNKAHSTKINPIKKWYKTLSTKTLSYVVKPSVLGEIPTLDDAATFYVLDEYSRANSLLLENQTQHAGLPPALQAVSRDGIFEQAALIFLKHRRADKLQKVSPRLLRLVEACLNDENLTVKLVPVTILWGRAPDKEDSLFKLLMADEWKVPSLSKQLFNIGVMGRDSHVQFYDAKDLQTLIAYAKEQLANRPNNVSEKTRAEQITAIIETRIKGYLTKQRTSILGPDMSDRRNITGSILMSQSVQQAIEQKAQATGKPIATIKKEAAGYIDEIASDYSHSVVRVFDRFLTWLWTQLYDGVEVRHFDRVRKLAPDYQIVYVPCHRSHMDYLLLSYVIYVRGLRIPYVAAGANLNIPVLGEILRSGGAFFLRRSFKDNPLYGAVFKAYFHSLMQRNTPIEYFIEGGRSRSGRLLAPKLGMIAMTVQSYLKQPAKPVVFIPTYISYERIMEGATYIGELKGKPKETENLLGLIKTARKIERIFGTVHLSFGEPLYLDNFLQKFDLPNPRTDDDSTKIPSEPDTDNPKLNAMIENLGVKVMQHINRAVVVNPVSLTALVLLSTPKAALDESLCLTQLGLYQRIATALLYDDDTHITDMPPKQMLAYAHKLKLIESTHHVLGNMVKVADKQAPLLNYFKNNILHIFILPSLVAALVQKNGRIQRDELLAVVSLLYPFLQTELFLKYALRNLGKVLQGTLDVLIETGLLVDFGDGTIGEPLGNTAAFEQLSILASPAQQSLERYFMAAVLLDKQGSGTLSRDEVVNLCYLLGGRLAVLYANDSPDLFDKALFANFLSTLVRLGYITEDDDKKLHFDERISQIASHARLVLNAETMQLLTNMTELSDDELASIAKADDKKSFFKSNG